MVDLVVPILYIPQSVNQSPGNLFDDAVAIWQFGANDGSIGTDKKGINNASSFAGYTKTSNNQILGNQTLTFSVPEFSAAYVEIPYHASLSHTNTSFTYAVLVYIPTLSNGSRQIIYFFSKYSDDTSARVISVGINGYGEPNGTTQLSFLVMDSAGTPRTITPYISQNAWHLLLFEFQNSPTNSERFLRIFDNNQQIAQSPAESNFQQITDTNHIYALLGNFVYNTTNSANAFRGANTYQYSYIATWRRVLTPDERDFLYNNGNFRYVE